MMASFFTSPPLKFRIIVEAFRPLRCISENAARMCSGFRADRGSAGGRNKGHTGAVNSCFGLLAGGSPSTPVLRLAADGASPLMSSRRDLIARASTQSERTTSKARKPRMSMVSSLARSCMCGGKLRNSLNRAALRWVKEAWRCSVYLRYSSLVISRVASSRCCDGVRSRCNHE
jgi:hypothetical protein